jgi:diadenosine tetraphosphate (Ap4A) HIT family hydrolase
MPDESPFVDGDCPFCDSEAVKHYVLHEGRDFYVIADFAPVSDGHLLLIPREHYPHIAALPPEMDEEFESLKALLGDYVRRHHGTLTYWENGIFGQSVPHAHLHAMSVTLDHAVYGEAGAGFEGIAGLRERHLDVGDGRYFAVEHEGVARVMPPNPELYSRVIRHARERNGGIWRYNAAERRMHGLPIIAETRQRWGDFVRANRDGAPPGDQERLKSLS